MKNSVSDSSFRFNRNAKSKPKLCAKKRDCSLLTTSTNKHNNTYLQCVITIKRNLI